MLFTARLGVCRCAEVCVGAAQTASGAAQAASGLFYNCIAKLISWDCVCAFHTRYRSAGKLDILKYLSAEASAISTCQYPMRITSLSNPYLHPNTHTNSSNIRSINNNQVISRFSSSIICLYIPVYFPLSEANKQVFTPSRSYITIYALDSHRALAYKSAFSIYTYPAVPNTTLVVC